MILKAIKYVIWNKLLRRPTEYERWLDREGWEISLNNFLRR